MSRTTIPSLLDNPADVAIVRDLITRARQLHATHRVTGRRDLREHTWSRAGITISVFDGQLYYSLGGDHITTRLADTPADVAALLADWDRRWGVMSADRITARGRNLAVAALADFGAVTRHEARVLLGMWRHRDLLTAADMEAVVGRFRAEGGDQR